MTVGELKNFLSNLPDDMRVMVDDYDKECYRDAHTAVDTIRNEDWVNETVVEIW